jgi:hypothetical protein
VGRWIRPLYYLTIPPYHTMHCITAIAGFEEVSHSLDLTSTRVEHGYRLRPGTLPIRAVHRPSRRMMVCCHPKFSRGGQ